MGSILWAGGRSQASWAAGALLAPPLWTAPRRAPMKTPPCRKGESLLQRVVPVEGPRTPSCSPWLPGSLAGGIWVVLSHSSIVTQLWVRKRPALPASFWFCPKEPAALQRLPLWANRSIRESSALPDMYVKLQSCSLCI